MKLRYLFFIILICSSCGRSKQANITDTVQSEIQTEGEYKYYTIKNNQIKVDLDKPQKASLFDYIKNIELIPCNFFL